MSDDSARQRFRGPWTWLDLTRHRPDISGAIHAAASSGVKGIGEIVSSLPLCDYDLCCR
jgi:hypothetical protein